MRMNAFLRRLQTVRGLLVLGISILLVTVVPGLTAAPPMLSPVTAQPAAQATLPVEAVPGYYSPNTTIEWRGGEVWFIRPPYQSRMLPVADMLYQFESGWIAGKRARFIPTSDGSTSLQIQSDDGNWNEFARAGEAYPTLPPELRAELEGVLDWTLANYPGVPGVAMYVNVPGYGVWMGARGEAVWQASIPLVPHDRFAVASVTKTFVATVVLQLAQEGILTLDDSVERWLPGVVPRGDTITIRHLLNHTSGIPNYLEGAFDTAYANNPGRIWTEAELVQFGVRRPNLFAAGDPRYWNYSNTNYVLLGMLIERATGHTTAHEVRWRIIEPLGLRNTTFEPYEPVVPGRANGYIGSYNAIERNMTIVYAAGGMVSTVEDMGMFIEALMQNRLLSPAMMNELYSFVNVHGAWGTRHLTYGAGLMQSRMSVAYRDGNDRPHEHGIVRGHTGALVGTRTAMWYLPYSGITITVAATQMYYDPNITVTRALDRILPYAEPNVP